MMSGEQYKESVNDGRSTYFEGQQVDNVATHPQAGMIDSTIRHLVRSGLL